MADRLPGSTEPVSTDLSKKRIYLTFRGSLTVADAQQLHDAYSRAISEVGRGYTAVSIFDGFVPGAADVQAIISKMIRMAGDNGCRAAARVGQGSVFGPLQLGRLQREVAATYPVKDFQTLAEAEDYLDALAD